MGQIQRIVLNCLTALALVVGASAVGTAALVATTQTASAQTIRAIDVNGNRRVARETVLSYVQFTVGDRYDAFQVDQSLKSLFDTGLFADVNIGLTGSTVVIQVVENPIVNIVAFEGNFEVDDETLGGEVQLKPRSVLTRSRVQADVQRILDVYSRQGRFAARVTPQVIELEQNRVNLVFEINEGPDTKVQDISFIGNRAFSDSQLQDVITTTETGLLSFLKPTNIYDPDRLNLDRELLRQFYLKNGYADARVISAVADLDRTGEGFFITFTVDEGEQYTFGSVEVVSSLEMVDVDALRGEVSSQSGDTYDAAAVDKTVERLTLAVSEQGYAFGTVRPRADRDPISRTIGITYVVEQGARIYIERIDILGNVRTRDYVIRREFRLAEGDAFNRLLVNRAKKRLQGMGFFSKVDIATRPGSARDRVVLIVQLQESATGEISFGGGYSTSEGVIGDISIQERNLMGRGQFLRLKLSGSIERAQIDLAFTEPRFLDRNLSAGFDIFHKEVDLSTEAGYKSRKTGGGLRFGFPVQENLWMNTRYSLVRDEVTDVESDASQTVIDREAEGALFTSSVGYSLTYDTRNIRSDPTEGYYLSLQQDFAGLGGDVYYVRAVAEGRAYFPVTKDITFVARAIGGAIAGWNGDGVRVNDTFYKGGETVRGFERAGFGPREITGTDANGNPIYGDSLGGTMFFAGTAEVRFPIPFLPEEIGLGGALFADAGSLFDVGEVSAGTNVADENGIRSSVGASLLWASPLGPLRADFAYVLSSEEFDEEEAFRFGASTKF